MNVNGNQRIAQLQCSVLDPKDAPLIAAITPGSRDDRTPSRNNRIVVKEDGLQLAESRFDMDFTCGNTRWTPRSASKHSVSDHVFSVVETLRTKVETAEYEGIDEDVVIYARKRRRLAGLPVMERFVTARLSRDLTLPENFFKGN